MLDPSDEAITSRAKLRKNGFIYIFFILQENKGTKSKLYPLNEHRP